MSYDGAKNATCIRGMLRYLFFRFVTRGGKDDTRVGNNVHARDNGSAAEDVSLR